ncbi:MAG: methyltransferase domain-containing protein [Candidatus Peribacteraceae bacterium]|nr:methyltransferase domain-containing protein [Candidatus Peribacteraceae bacterium]
MANKSFTTSFGRQIPFVEGYLEAHARNPWENDWSDQEAEGFMTSPMSYSSFRKDLVEYAVARKFLHSLGVKGPWGSALEIGGREAVVARLIKGEGTEYVETIDLKPYYKRLSTPLFKTRMRDVFAPKVRGIRVPRRLAGLANPKYYDWAQSQAREFGLQPDRNFGWDIKMVREPDLGTYTIGDVNTYDFKRKYDFVSAMGCLDYFDPEHLFKRVSSILNPGGIFVFLFEYWWFPVNTTDVVGHFPYVTQRLTRDDFIRYAAENFSAKEADWLLKRRDYYHQGNVLVPKQYCDIADKNDLYVLGEHRCMTLRNYFRRTSMTPYFLDQFEDSKLKDVMEDIKQFRGDVSLADLKTGFMMMAFEKRGPRKPHVQERIKEVPKLR